MLIYRPHRGSLADAMAEAKTFNSFDEIKEYVANEWNSIWGWNILNPNDIVLGDDIGDDNRVGWRNCHYLCTKKLDNEDYMKEYGCPKCIGFVGEINDAN